MLLRLLALSFLLFLSACSEDATHAKGARILAVGDSLMASNRALGQSVPQEIERLLGEEVVDRSIPGARFLHALPLSGAAGLRIASQFQAGDWDVVIVNGGGNDLLFGCACGRCDGVLNRLISSDGRAGAIPAFVKSVRDSGARVVMVGYLRNPGVVTPIKGCRPAGDELDRRLAALDRLDDGMVFVALADLVPHGDTSFHGIDQIHPSAKGSTAIARRLAPHVKAALSP
jgi:lysophospholipase L1-like esterase